MFNASSRPDITAALTRGTARLLMDMGLAPITEWVLPNGLRADIAALSNEGGLWIVEVKSGSEDYKADAKWPGYDEWCDQFYFAVAAEFPTHTLPNEVGLIVADGFGGQIVRPSPVTPLNAARRKSLLIRFARAAAMTRFT